MRKYFLCVILLFVIMVIPPSVVYGLSVCGDLEGDVVWSKVDNPVSICNTVELPEGASLSIRPGVEVFLEGESNFTAYGSLLVQGSQDEPVIFRGNPNSLSLGGSASSTFIHLRDVRLESIRPGFYIDNAKVIVENVFVNGGEGFSFDGSDVVISSSTFLGLEGDAISLYGTKALLENVLVRGTVRGSGISAYENTDLYLSSTTVSSGEFTGLAVYDSMVKGARNRFISNYPAGVEVYGSSSLSLNRTSFGNSLFEMVSFSDATSTATGSWWSGHSPQPGVDYLGNVDVGSWLTFDPNSKRPDVVFFPGIQASRLFLEEEGKQNQLWEPNRALDLEKLFLDDEGHSAESGVYVGEVIDQINVSIKTRKIYKTFIDNLTEWKSQGLINDYKLWAYDWRYPISTLATIFTETAAISRPTVFIGHSNGGLLAKIVFSLLPQISREMVSLVLVASPQRGSVQALATLLHADSTSILGGLILTQKLALSFISPMISVYTLLPWSDALKLISFDQTILDKIPSIGNVAWSQFLRDFPLASLAGAKFNFELPKIKQQVFDAAKNIQNTLAVIDGSLKPDLTIYGYGIRTLGSIHYGAKESCGEGSVFSKMHICKPSLTISYSPVYKDGDGTVEVQSAWPSYPATSSSVFPVNLKNSNYTHSTVLEDSRVLRSVEDFLATVPRELVGAEVASASGPIVSEDETDQDLIIRINDPSLRAVLKNKKGEITGLVETGDGEGEMVVVETIPGTTFRKFGGNTEIIISDYPQKIHSDDESVSFYELSFVGDDIGEAEVVIGEVSYPNFPVVPGSFGSANLVSLEAPDITYYPVGTSSVPYYISPDSDGSVLEEAEGEVAKHLINGYCIQRKTGQVVPKPGYLQ